MRKLHYIIILTAMLLSFKNIQAQLPSSDPLFSTIFIDEFDSLRANNWTLHPNWGQEFTYDTTHNCGFLQHTAGLNINYTDTHNIQLSNIGGITSLKLKAQKGNFTVNHNIYYNCGVQSICSPPPICVSAGAGCILNQTNDTCYCAIPAPTTYKYSNAALYGNSYFKFGYFEIKFRMPNFISSVYTPVSPTFWLYSASKLIPWSEIDIYEIDAYNTTSNNWTNNIHVNAIPGSSGASRDFNDSAGVNFSGNVWHTASINWTPNYINFYYDGNFVRQSVNDTNHYLIPMQLIVENGIPATNFCHADIDSVHTPFPIIYEVDYIKVLQPVCDCATDKTYCSGSYVSKIYKSLTIGGSGCNMAFSNTSNSTVQSIAANDYVLLQEGFSVDGSNSNPLTIDVQPYCSDSIKFIQKTTRDIYPMPVNYMQTKHNENQN